MTAEKNYALMRAYSASITIIGTSANNISGH
jgi:hypothetical protein